MSIYLKESISYCSSILKKNNNPDRIYQTGKMQYGSTPENSTAGNTLQSSDKSGRSLSHGITEKKTEAQLINNLQENRDNHITRLFSTENVVNGIIMAEILGKPKSRRGR